MTISHFQPLCDALRANRPAEYSHMFFSIHENIAEEVVTEEIVDGDIIEETITEEEVVEETLEERINIQKISSM